MLKSKMNIRTALAGLFICLAIANQAQAHRDHGGYSSHGSHGKERVELYFDNWHLRGQRTVLLKRELKRQYPGIDLHNVELRKVVVLAKTRRGRGLATLRVGNHYSRTEIVRGHPEAFHRPDAFYQPVVFKSPKRDSRGPWQLQLQGNFKIDSVKLVLVRDDRRRSSRDRRHGQDYHRAPRHSRRGASPSVHPVRRQHEWYARQG